MQLLRPESNAFSAFDESGQLQNRSSTYCVQINTLLRPNQIQTDFSLKLLIKNELLNFPISKKSATQSPEILNFSTI